MRALLLCLGLPLLAQDATAAFFKGDPKLVMAQCADRAQTMNLKDSRSLAEFGRAYLLAGLPNKAEAAFAAITTMQTADPKARNVFKQMAINLLEAGCLPEAIALMDRAWTLDPKDWHDHLDFARAALRLGQQDLACLYLERTVKARPKEERVWSEIMLLFAEQQNPAWPAHP